jgi:hypothetical protein
VVNEAANTNLMPEGIFAERERLADQVRTALAECVVEALDVGGLSRLFADRSMALRRQDSVIGLIEVAITDAALAIVGRKRLPQRTAGGFRAVPKGQSDDATCLALQDQPNPHDIPFVTNKRPQFVELKQWPLTKWCDRLPNREYQLFFFQTPATVRRLILSVRATARCERRSSCN